MVGDIVALQSQANGKYVCADNGGTSPLIANRTTYSTWEEFKVIDAGGGHIALQALANNLYVCADNTGTSPLIANRGTYGTWEEYNVINTGNGLIALQSLANNLYVCADNAGTRPLIANRGTYGTWEEYNVVVVTTSGGLSLLHTSGTNIVNASGNVILLKGVNLGGLFVMEKWMTPLDSSGLPDTYSVIQKLDSRFGVATEQSLISGYQANWITTADLDNIKNGGYNCVRVPVWWGNFFTLSSYGASSGWRSDAFTELDWLVSNCASRGIYVIIDMHGVVGGQSVSDDTGQQNQNTYWSNGTYQGNTAWMWWQIANHYDGNITVAGYDLLNEPLGAPRSTAVISAYNGLYSSVRSADPNHIIIMEGAFGNWNWSMLPNPSTYGWTNIVYEMHEYQYGGNVTQCEAGSNNQVTDFNNHKSWNVPAYIGEWNNMGNGASCYAYSISDYTNNGMSWTIWTYKATAGLLPNGWGWYDPTYWPTTPNISSDSASTISSDWQQWQTTSSFGKNSSIGL